MQPTDEQWKDIVKRVRNLESRLQYLEDKDFRLLAKSLMYPTGDGCKLDMTCLRVFLKNVEPKQKKED